MPRRNKAKPEATETPPDNHRGPRPRVLIAEDDQEMATLLADVLRKAGYETTVCDNGQDLLKLMGFGGEPEQDPDLVISDIRLPRFSGLDALRASHYSGGFPPMILITAFGDEWTHAKAAQLGAVHMFDKPFDVDDLVKKVRELVPPA